MAARERAEQLLQEARAAIQVLETKLAHEQKATEEAVRRSENVRQAIQDKLTTERAARQQADQERDLAIAAHQKAEERLCVLMAGQEAQPAARAARAKRGRPARLAGSLQPHEKPGVAQDITPATGAGDDAPTNRVSRRRGQQPEEVWVSFRGMVEAGLAGAILIRIPPAVHQRRAAAHGKSSSSPDGARHFDGNLAQLVPFKRS